MIGFLCHPMSFFYTFKKITLRRGPESSPDNQGFQGMKKGEKPAFSLAHPVGAHRFPRLLTQVPWRGHSVGTSLPEQVCIMVSRQLHGGESNFLWRGGQRSWVLNAFQPLSNPSKLSREMSFIIAGIVSVSGMAFDAF